MNGHDVIVVGAGAAGIAAGRRLTGAGIAVRILEADRQPGGRCITDQATFGHPFDRGGSWIHSAAINPLAPLAQSQGFTISEDRPGDLGRIAVGDDCLDATAAAAYRETWRALLGAEAAPSSAGDPPVADFVPATEWGPWVRHVVALLSGVDAAQCSSVDFNAFRYAPGEWLLAEGQGTLLAGLARNLPIRLSTPVTAIDHRSSPIRVETAAGVLEAAAVIVTVSTGVLAAGGIRFTPELPAAMTDALHGLPLGLLNKVGLAARPGSPLAEPGEVLMHHPSPDAAVMFRPGFMGHPVLCAFVGGSLADELEAAGPGAATALCRDGIRALFGADALRETGHASETAWRSHPWSLGAYSAALPGAASARAVLAEGVSERLLLAGEATDPELFSTVGGAWASGIAAAERLIDNLETRREKA